MTRQTGSVHITTGVDYRGSVPVTHMSLKPPISPEKAETIQDALGSFGSRATVAPDSVVFSPSLVSAEWTVAAAAIVLALQPGSVTFDSTLIL